MQAFEALVPKKRIQHHDDYTALTDSAAAGCWCCGAVAAQFDVALQDAETPPTIHVSSDLKVPRLLMWFAERTWTKTGYLDPFQRMSKWSISQSAFSSLPFLNRS
jgi:hypothetical protein